MKHAKPFWAPTPFPGAKKFFFSNIKVLHVNNMGDFSLFVEQDISDKK